jgi:hypothetical protein
MSRREWIAIVVSKGLGTVLIFLAADGSLHFAAGGERLKRLACLSQRLGSKQEPQGLLP